MERVIVNNIPSSNRKDFGYRGINTSKSHNDNQNDMVNDILDLFNKTNEIERIVKENADFIKLENTNLESINSSLINEYENLVDDFNSILGGQSTRKKVILPKDCYVDDKLYGAVINNTTCDITARPSRKISKLAVFDSITDGIYIPDSLEVDIRSRTINTISETDNDIYAPFYNDNQMYWTRKVVTDNTVDEVVTEYIINLAEEIMTTAEMNEITIHPFLGNISNVYVRYGDSNPWEEIEGVNYHPAVGNDQKTGYMKTPRPLTLTFPNVKANQIKIILRSTTFMEGETNLRNFMFGIKHIGAYINYYGTYDSYNFSTEVSFDEIDDVVIEGLTFDFNNDSQSSKFNSDIDYEFYYKDEYGSYQKIYEELPFVAPSKDILIKLRIGEKYKEVNLRAITVSYKAIRQDYSLLVSYMQDMRVDYQENFNVYFTVKASDSNELTEITSCEITLDDGVTWTDMNVAFDGLRYRYEHESLKEVTIKDRCMIRVYDFDGRCGVSNKFRISAEIFDLVPEIDHIQNFVAKVGETFKVYYYAGDDNRITKHEFSDSNGNDWTNVVPGEEVSDVRGLTFKRYYLELTFKTVGVKNCLIRVYDGINEPVESNEFEIDVKAIEPSGITIDNYVATINRGTTLKLNQSIVPSNTTNKAIHWSTSDPSVASVDEFGLVRAINKGTCKIKVETYNREHYAICDLTVLVPVSNVTLNSTNLALYIGEQFDLNETIYPADANNKAVRWSCANSNITISNSGLVTAIRTGSSSVTVTSVDGGHSATCIVEIRVPVSDLLLNKESLTMQVDDQHQLLATVKPDNAYNKTVNWSSSNPSIVSVNNGLLTALSHGNVMITATTDHKGIPKYCTVNVLTPVSAVTLNKINTRIYLDQTEKLTATVIPSDAFNKAIRWRSSNTSVATVDENGTVVPISTGQTIISVTTEDRSKVASCNVVVVSRVSDFNLNYSSVKVLAVGETQWGKEIDIALESFLSTTITEKEEILITSDNENVVMPVHVDGNEWTTDLNRLIKFKAVGLNNGIANINVALKSGRISKSLVVQAGKPIESFQFEDVDIIDNVPTVKIPAGFSRKVRYNIKPINCIFHFGDCEGSLSPNHPEYASLDLVDSGVVGIYHNQVFSETVKEITNTYTCRGFYNNLGKFDVNWISEKYNIELNWSDEHPQVSKVDKFGSVTIPLRFVPIDELQGQVSDYDFVDDMTIANNVVDAAKFNMVSFSITNSDDQFEALLKVALKPGSENVENKKNIIRIKGKNAANYVEVPLTLVVE